MKTKMDKRFCSGCRNDFYNNNNSLGVAECWSFKTASVVSRIPVGMQEPPPYKNRKKVKIPDCYHGNGPYRTIYIEAEALTNDGYWR